MPVEVKVADYNGRAVDLQELLGKYSGDFELAAIGLAVQYQLPIIEEEDTYLIHISCSPPVPNQKFNFILQISGPNEKKTRELLEDVTSKLELDFREAPKLIRNRFLEKDKHRYPDHYKN